MARCANFGTVRKFREERYAWPSRSRALRAARAFQTPDAMPLYEKMITEGAWWDYVDAIATHKRRGHFAKAIPTPMKKLMLRWSKSDSMWKARTSIICQVLAKKETDLDLLYGCIEPSLASKEFFSSARRSAGRCARTRGSMRAR